MLEKRKGSRVAMFFRSVRGGCPEINASLEASTNPQANNVIPGRLASLCDAEYPTASGTSPVR